MVPELAKKFPEIEFRVEDPSEGLKPPDEGWWVILDVAKPTSPKATAGQGEIMVFEDLNKLVTEKRVSLHDYDVSMELKLLKRIGKVNKLKIVAVPMEMGTKEAFRKIVRILEEIPGTEPEK